VIEKLGRNYVIDTAGHPSAIGGPNGTPALIKLNNQYYPVVLYGLRAITGTIRPKWTVQLRDTNTRMGLRDYGGAWFTIGEFAANPSKGWNDTMLWLHFYHGDVTNLFEPSDKDHAQLERMSLIENHPASLLDGPVVS